MVLCSGDWIIEKAREFQTSIYFCFIDYPKAFDCVEHTKLWKILLFSPIAHSCLAVCDPMDCSMPGIPVHHKLIEFTQTDVHRVSDAINHLIFCCPLLFPPSIFPSSRVFSRESVLPIRWLKYWSFSFSISLSNDYSGLNPFRMDGLYLLAVQGTLKSLLQHHSSKGSILWCSAFFIVQLSHLYRTTGKAIALTRCNLLTK